MTGFYESAFGWVTRPLGEEMGGYVTATTVETDDQGPVRPGAINGGFYPARPDEPHPSPSLVIAVEDIRESVRKIAEAGGRVLGEPVDIPGVGPYVSFVDTEGNRLSVLQPVPRNWHAPNK